MHCWILFLQHVHQLPSHFQDCGLTYAAWQKMCTNYPKNELDLIDLTTRMYVEPKLVLDPEVCIVVVSFSLHLSVGKSVVRIRVSRAEFADR